MKTLKLISPSILPILFLVSFTLQNQASASEPDKVRKTKKEITKTDITRYKDITAEEILIFGIHLNMSIDEVVGIIKEYEDMYLQVDPFNDNRYYLFDKRKIGDKDISLAYFIWDENNPDKGLQEIILYFGFSKYLVGNSKNLLTIEVINKNSEIVREFIGYPTKKETNLDLPDLGIKSFSYFYPEKQFKINRYISDHGTSISFSIFQAN